MPHVKLEYTENVQWKNPIQDIFSKLQTVLIQHARVKSQNCNSRATELKNLNTPVKVTLVASFIWK